MTDIIKTYIDAGNIFFEPGFKNFKREKSFLSFFVTKQTAKSEFIKLVTEYVIQNPKIAEIELRQILLHIDNFIPNELTPEFIKEKFYKFGMIFFKNGYKIARQKYGFAMKFFNENESLERVKEGIEWYVTNDFVSAKANLISLRLLLHTRLDK